MKFKCGFFFWMKSTIFKLKILNSSRITVRQRLNTNTSPEGNCGPFFFSVTCYSLTSVTHTPQNDIMPTLLSEEFLEERTYLRNNRTVF